MVVGRAPGRVHARPRQPGALSDTAPAADPSTALVADERAQLTAFVLAAHRRVCATARELAHHCGHADALHEQLLAQAPPT